MSVFTYFNHGTAFHRDKEGEIVAEFGRLAAGTEYTNFLILDGPGSTPTSAPTPGRFNPFTRHKTGKKTFGSREMGHTHKNWAVTGLLTGAGWDDNVMHAVAALAEVDPLPEAVNMIGWSRGAVTCTKLAYTLNEFFPQVKVNIFAIDPVAGIGNKSDTDASTIYSNVKNYLAVLSMHETRGFFKPQDIKRVTFASRETNAIYLPFPGNHSGQVSLDKSCQKGIGEAAQIVWFMGMVFLKHFGTQFNRNPSPTYSFQEICNFYANMSRKMPSYRKTRPGFFGGVAMGGRKTRDFLSHRVHQYVKHSSFFINEHHRRVFKRAYPGLYDYVFEDRGSDVKRIAAEFRSTRNLTALHGVLEDLGFSDGLRGVMLPIRGGGKEEVRVLRRQHTASLGRMGLD